MFFSSVRRGIKLVEVIVVVFVLGLIVALLLPSVECARESARRAACINNMKQIGLALHNYYDAHKSFPASNSIPLQETPSDSWRDVSLHTPAEPDPGAGSAEYGTNFSWLTTILPYLEEERVYGMIDTDLRAWDTSNLVDSRTDLPADPGRPCHQYAWMKPITPFKCPSVPLGDYCEANPRAGVKTNPYDPSMPYGPAAITNYVALGATHSDSLLGVETSLSAGGERHPNGVIYPGSRTTFDDLMDGTNHTLVACETREVSLSAWWEGSTAAVFGLAGSPSFVPASQNAGPDAEFGRPAFDILTTLNYGDDMANPVLYYLKEGPQGVPWVHGPSSCHPGVVHHIVGDSSVRVIPESVDPHVYMWIITRAGSEPVDQFEEPIQ
jgi:type II secretory pathway pseudopilin PulG